MTKVSILYFAKVRDLAGMDREDLDLPEGLTTVIDVMGWLSANNPARAAALGDRKKLRCALDQRMARFDDCIAGVTEIAFFPPVTGG